MEAATKYLCCDVCKDSCQKPDGKCGSDCKCATECQCCIGSASTPSAVHKPLVESDKKCTCKTDGVCTCPKEACDCK